MWFGVVEYRHNGAEEQNSTVERRRKLQGREREQTEGQEAQNSASFPVASRSVLWYNDRRTEIFQDRAERSEQIFKFSKDSQKAQNGAERRSGPASPSFTC